MARIPFGKPSCRYTLRHLAKRTVRHARSSSDRRCTPSRLQIHESPHSRAGLGRRAGIFQRLGADCSLLSGLGQQLNSLLSRRAFGRLSRFERSASDTDARPLRHTPVFRAPAPAALARRWSPVHERGRRRGRPSIRHATTGCCAHYLCGALGLRQVSLTMVGRSRIFDTSLCPRFLYARNLARKCPPNRGALQVTPSSLWITRPGRASSRNCGRQVRELG